MTRDQETQIDGLTLLLKEFMFEKILQRLATDNRVNSVNYDGQYCAIVQVWHTDQIAMAVDRYKASFFREIKTLPL